MKIPIPAVALLMWIPVATAQNQTDQVTSGNPSVTVEGKPSATQGDTTGNSGVVIEGSSNVVIGGKPAATMGSATGCGAGVVSGGSSVLVNGKPLATSGSEVSPCPE